MGTLKPKDIRPAAYESVKVERMREDIDWLLARRASFIEVSCPACEAAVPAPAFEKYGFHFVECGRCRTVYMNPRATSDLMEAFYANSALYEFWNRCIFPASRQVRCERVFRPRAEAVHALCDLHGIETGCLVDLGAAAGMFCEEIHRVGRFPRIVAVEPNRAQAETCRDLGFETVEGTIADCNHLHGKVHVVSSFEVIEHVFSPAAFLEDIRRLLVPGGLVVVTCPNYHGFDTQVLGTRSESLDAEHVNLFNPQSLPLLFERCGFTVLECSTPGQLDAEIVREAALKGEIDLSGQPFLSTVLLDRWAELGESFQAFLRNSRLSSHMWLAARLAA